MSEQTGRAFVLCGPTAVGKDTVLKELLKKIDKVWLSISATTRHPRPGEVDGKDYYFVDEKHFLELVTNGEMLEWAKVHGHYYGTPRPPVTQALANGQDVILEIDLGGARQVRKSLPQAVQIFLAPPSWEELKKRLRGRGTEDAAEQKIRLATAKTELAAQNEFDYVVINDAVANATSKILHIINNCEYNKAVHS